MKTRNLSTLRFIRSLSGSEWRCREGWCHDSSSHSCRHWTGCAQAPWPTLMGWSELVAIASTATIQKASTDTCHWLKVPGRTEVLARSSVLSKWTDT